MRRHLKAPDRAALLGANLRNELSGLAVALDYWPSAPPVEPQLPRVPRVDEPVPVLPPRDEPAYADAPARFWCVTEARFGDNEPAASGQEPAEFVDPPYQPQPPTQPLCPWNVLWKQLAPLVRRAEHSRRLDVERLVRRVAKGQPLASLPYKARHAAAERLFVVLEHTEDLIPLWDDQLRVLEGLRRELPRSVFVHVVEGGRDLELGSVKWRSLDDERADDQVLKPGATVLWVGAAVFVGAQDENRETLRVRRSGFDRATSSLRVHTCVLLTTPAGTARPGQQVIRWPGAGVEVTTAAVERVLRLLAPAIRIETGLLRDICRLVGGNVDLELAVWNHPDVEMRVPNGCALFPEASKRWMDRVDALWAAEATPEVLYERKLQLDAWTIIAAWRKRLSGVIHAEEICALALRKPDKVPWAERSHGSAGAHWLIGERELAEASEQLTQVAARWTDKRGETDPGVVAWSGRVLGRIGEKGLKPKHAPLRVALGALSHAANQGRQKSPPGDWVLPGASSAPLREISLSQAGNLAFAAHAALPGSPLAHVRSKERIWLVPPPRRMYSPQTGSNVVPWWELTGDEALICTDVDDAYTLRLLEKPAWASAMGRDRYGLFAEADFNGVTQRMRWINPGQFMMGSPLHEEGRDEDETLHSVSLTQGYWLADTACTQALWQAVMGDNPSYFSGDEYPDAQERPVEQVSWEDVQNFIAQLSDTAADGMQWRLPTEAEWEHACRAGTKTAYGFGDSMTSEQANFRHRADRQELRGTVTVKHSKFSPNDWGLYQMHGNVWEWCWDCLGEYPVGPAVNPIRSEQGVSRVVRGGSWDSVAQNARSAYRDAGPPDYRSLVMSFRLARRHTNQLQEVPAEPEQHAAKRRSGPRPGGPKSRLGGAQPAPSGGRSKGGRV